VRIFFPSAATVLTDHRGHGEGLIAWSICSGLAARGHELVVCAREADLKANPEFEVIEIGPASRWESIEPLAYAIRTARVLRRLGGARRFDVIHWLFPQGREDVLFLPPGSTAFIVGPHSLVWPTPSTPLRAGDVVRATATPLFLALHRRALGRAGVLLVSTPDAVSVVPRTFRSKVQVLPFGIEGTSIAPSADPPPQPTIAFVGRLEPAKGVLKLVDAFARVKEDVPDATLVVAGEGPERGSLESRSARLGLGDSVKLLGLVPHQRVSDVFRSSAVVCLPSDGEPYGMAVLEAMAAGRAIVTPDSGGPRFLLAHDGGDQLVAHYDADSLARALVRLLTDRKLLTKLGRENRERVKSKFTLDRVLDELESIYEGAQ
jgi:glycosyltransferase involved in cell wall biosynthesis